MTVIVQEMLHITRSSRPTPVWLDRPDLVLAVTRVEGNSSSSYRAVLKELSGPGVFRVIRAAVTRDVFIPAPPRPKPPKPSAAAIRVLKELATEQWWIKDFGPMPFKIQLVHRRSGSKRNVNRQVFEGMVSQNLVCQSITHEGQSPKIWVITERARKLVTGN